MPVPPSAGPPSPDPRSDDRPAPGYYPDPSIPGFVRYWDGEHWLPGTSRPAPAEGEELPPPRAAARPNAPSMSFVPPPAPLRPAPEQLEPQQFESRPVEESGPIYLDETTGQPLARPDEGDPSGAAETTLERESRWRADAAQQRGLLETESVPRWVSWGAPVGQEARSASVAELSPSADGPRPLVLTPAPVSVPGPAPFPAPARALHPVPATTPEPFLDPVLDPVPAVGPAPVLAPARTPAPAPRRATPQSPVAQSPLPLPLAAPPAPVASLPAAPPATVTAAAAPPSAAPAPAVAPPPAATPVPAPRQVRPLGGRPSGPRPAPLGRRFAARLFDLVLTAVLVAPLAAPLVQSVVTHLQDKIDAARALTGPTTVWLVDPTVLRSAGLLLLGVLAVGLVYEVLPTTLWGRTLGKAVFGLRVVGLRSKRAPGFGRSLSRWLCYQLPLLLLVGVLELLWCTIDRPWRQCWHDKAAGTFVASGATESSRMGRVHPVGRT